MFMEDGHAGVSHHAHLLHERRQPVPLRREHRADGGRAGRRAPRCSAPTRRAPSSTSSTRPAATVRGHHAGHRRPPRGSRATTSTPTGRWARTGGSTSAASTATTTACATPAFPASGAARSRPASPGILTNGYIRLVGQGHRRPQPVHSRPAVHQPDRPAVRPRLRQLRLVEHRRRARPSGADPDRRSEAAARQRAQDQGQLVHRRRGVRPRPTTGTSRTPPR